MQRNSVMFVIHVCHVDFLPRVAYKVWHQYSTDVSARHGLDSERNYSS